MIFDFGLARPMLSKGRIDRRIRTLSIVGTGPFQSYNLIAQQRYGSKVDSYALGISFFRMATGKFPMNIRKPETIKQYVIQRMPVENHILLQEVNPKIKDLIGKLCDHDADKRWSIEQALGHSLFDGIRAKEGSTT